MIAQPADSQPCGARYERPGGADGNHVELDEHGDEMASWPSAELKAPAPHHYTSHGHPCCGKARVGDRPAAIARCGGSAICSRCASEAASIHVAHARTDLPRLLTELDQRTEQLEKAWADIAAMAAALVQLEDAQVVIAADNDRLGAELDTARAEVARLTTVKRMLKETVAAVPDAHHAANLAEARAERDRLRA